MVKTASLLFLSVLLLSFSQARAEDQEEKGITSKKAASRELSVYQIIPWVDGPVLAAASAGAVLPLYYESTLVHPHALGDPHDINSIDRTAVGNRNKTVALFSHLQVAMAIAVPMVLDAKDVGFNKTLTEDFVVYAQVLAINSALSNAARYSVQRPRPDVYRPGANVNDPGEFLSFYSGHVASTVSALSAASMTYNYRYGRHWWPWAVTFVAGVTEAAERTVAGRHYYSDDLVGAMMGATVGIVVPMLHHRRGPNQISLAPAERGAQLVWRRVF